LAIDINEREYVVGDGGVKVEDEPINIGINPYLPGS
jgi:hypothetical protein